VGKSVVKHWAPGESMKTGSGPKRERMATYVNWLLTPPSERDPKTKTALAESLGVSLQTLANYSKEAWVQREIGDKARRVARVDKLPAVLENLYAIAAGDAESKPSEQVSAAKVLMDWLEKTSTVREATLDVNEMTDEALVGHVLEILQRVSEKG
jgi:hypothetical protein